MNEVNIIKAMLAKFDRSHAQLNAPFAADAELVNWGACCLGGDILGISMDEFSAEDGFGAATPERIGHNVAVATISDLYASGVTPQFFLQSVTLPESNAEDFATGLAQGVAEVLRTCNCFLLGGDAGQAEHWRYVGVAFGSARKGRPLTRQLPCAGNYDLWATGYFGDANAAVFAGLPAPAFELRNLQAAAIRDTAAAAIDSSDGFMLSMWQLSQLNPTFRFEVDLAAVLMDDATAQFAAHNGFNPHALLWGGAGEYELIFALPEGVTAGLPDTTRIGHIEAGSGLHLRTGSHLKEVIQAPPCPRQFAQRSHYIAAVLAALEAVQ
jgi:thiamine-monophosphate kinase